jgi:hypothetical protein
VFTTLGVKVDRSVYGPRGIYTFRVKGELCHRIGSLLPPPDGEPAFAQIYVFDTDPDRQANARMMHHRSSDGGYLLDRDRVISLPEMSSICNSYVLTYRMAVERWEAGNDVRELRIKFYGLNFAVSWRVTWDGWHCIDYWDCIPHHLLAGCNYNTLRARYAGL